MGTEKRAIATTPVGDHVGGRKVAQPFLKNEKLAAEKTAMAVVLRTVAGHNWGWFSREDQRMHIQTVDKDSLEGPNKAKAWLENRGRRIFERAGGSLSAADWKKLETKVRGDRDLIESRWAVFMVENDWIKAEVTGSTVTLTAYPASHHSFATTVDLRREFPGAYPFWDKNAPKVDLRSSPGLIAVGPEDDPDERNHLKLAEFLFTD